MKGVVKCFDGDSGWGVIKPEGPGYDVNVHITAAEAAGILRLKKGDHLSFDLTAGPEGRPLAINLGIHRP